MSSCLTVRVRFSLENLTLMPVPNKKGARHFEGTRSESRNVGACVQQFPADSRLNRWPPAATPNRTFRSGNAGQQILPTNSLLAPQHDRT